MWPCMQTIGCPSRAIELAGSRAYWAWQYQNTDLLAQEPKGFPVLAVDEAER